MSKDILNLKNSSFHQALLLSQLLRSLRQEDHLSLDYKMLCSLDVINMGNLLGAGD